MGSSRNPCYFNVTKRCVPLTVKSDELPVTCQEAWDSIAGGFVLNLSMLNDGYQLHGDAEEKRTFSKRTTDNLRIQFVRIDRPQRSPRAKDAENMGRGSSCGGYGNGVDLGHQFDSDANALPASPHIVGSVTQFNKRLTVPRGRDRMSERSSGCG